MSVSFQCQQCGQVVHAGEESGGRAVECPHCRLPAFVPQSAGRHRDPRSLVGQRGEYVFPASASAYPRDAATPQLPPPAFSPSPPSRQQARSRLAGPAIGIIVSAVLCLLSAPVFTVNNIEHRATMRQSPAVRSERAWHTTLMYSIFCVHVVAAFLAIGGSIAMLSVRSYGLAWTGVIAALLPCNPCFVVGIPFAIWGMTVLADRGVKDCFYRSWDGIGQF